MARGWAAAEDIGECFGITQPLMKDVIRDAGMGCWNGMDSWQRNEMLWMDTCWFLVIFGMLRIELDLRNNSGILKRLMPPFQVHNDSIHFSLFFSLFCKICPPVCVCVHSPVCGVCVQACI